MYSRFVVVMSWTSWNSWDSMKGNKADFAQVDEENSIHPIEGLG